MATNAALSTDTSSGTQSSTNNPQLSSDSSSFGGNVSSGIQPGGTIDVLNSGQTGILLQPNSLPTISFNKTIATTTTATPVKSLNHQANPIFLGFAGLLFIIAIAIFIQINNSAKNTTI